MYNFRQDSRIVIENFPISVKFENKDFQYKQSNGFNSKSVKVNNKYERER